MFANTRTEQIKLLWPTEMGLPHYFHNAGVGKNKLQSKRVISRTKRFPLERRMKISGIDVNLNTLPDDRLGCI
jgi:hypothetical protein